GGHQHAVAGAGDDDKLTGPGERGDDMRGLRAAAPARARGAQRAPRPGAGAAARDRGVRPDADRHAEPRAAEGRDRLLFAGTCRAGHGGGGGRARGGGGGGGGGGGPPAPPPPPPTTKKRARGVLFLPPP